MLAGLLGTLLLMLLGAVLVHRGTLAEGAIAPCALVFLALGSALAALVAAKRAGENQFYWSLGAGFAVFLILLIVAVLPLGQSIHFVRTVISLLCFVDRPRHWAVTPVPICGKKKRYSHIKNRREIK